MQENLNIEVLLKEKTAVLELSGRLDANWAGHLDENIQKLVRAGTYDIVLNTSGIVYISSAGIRILVKQYKNLQSVGGKLSISVFSENVKEVLNMVGMVDMFTAKEEKNTPQTSLSTEAFLQSGYRFMPTTVKEKSIMNITLHGTPDKLVSGEYAACKKLAFKENNYAVGIGAIGTDFNDCRDRFGEYLAMGDAVAYMPSDKSGIPDYTLKTGQLIPAIQSLYSLAFDGEFSTRYRFITDGREKQISLSNILEAVQKHQVRDTIAFIMIAESGGLVGTTLNNSPVNKQDPFEFPQIRDRVNFSIEPAHNRMITVSVGVVSKSKDEKLLTFLRPTTKNSALSCHVHTAIFPYQTLKKQGLELHQTIHHFLEESMIKDIMHLTNDHREITGLGESQFIHGYLWCAPATF